MKQGAAILAVATAATFTAGCGSDDEPDSGTGSEAPAASTFPAADGTLNELLSTATPADDLVVSPATSIYTVGKNRMGVGVFNIDGTQDDSAEVAIYVAHGATGQAEGPFPATRESLITPPAYASQTTTGDPDAAKTVYVVNGLELTKPGEWRVVAAVQRDGETEMTRVAPSIVVQPEDPLPGPGDKAPTVHTPTVDDVGSITDIDTRVPPDTMHDVDLADVLGKKPVVISFATPALCTSRVCGPVVDIVEEVKDERPDDAAYIHEEIYQDNDPAKPLTEPFAAYQPEERQLQSEPWLFVINSDGTISSRIQGAFSKGELEAALDKVS